MASIADLERAFYIKELGLVEPANLSNNDLKAMYLETKLEETP